VIRLHRQNLSENIHFNWNNYSHTISVCQLCSTHGAYMLRILNLYRLILGSDVVRVVVLSARFSGVRSSEGTCQRRLSVRDKAVRLDLSYQLKFLTIFFKTLNSVKALCQYTILSSRPLAITTHPPTHTHARAHTHILKEVRSETQLQTKFRVHRDQTFADGRL